MGTRKKIKKNLRDLARFFSAASFMFLLVMPASTNYQLKDYSFGTGGVANSTDGNGHSLEAISGEQGGQKENSTLYGIGSGLSFTNQADVPTAPTFTNPGSSNSSLQLVVNTSGNPSDTRYVVAISADSFATTQYVQSIDGTVGSTQDYESYSAWGGSSGIPVVGLAAGTTYQVKVKAMQGKFTETGYGPTASAATVGSTLSFGITTDTQSSPPFTIDFGNMIPGSVNTSAHQINVTFSTSAANGGNVYVAGSNGGLHSVLASHTINALSADLTGQSEGYGLQGGSATQSSGGPLTVATIYNQGGSTVGIADPSMRSIFASATPITGGSASIFLKAKPSTTAPAANDYAETLTVVASGSF